MVTRRLFAIVPLLSFLVLSGCGYELVRGLGVSGSEITSLSVPIFKNATYEPLVPTFFTEAFSREFASSGLTKMNQTASEATLQGTVTSVTTTQSALSTQGLAVEKTVIASISLTLTRQGYPSRSWGFSDSEAYAANDINAEEFNRRAALQRLAQRLARRFHSQLVGY